MIIHGYIFEIYNKEFDSITSPNFKRLVITIIDDKDRHKIIKQIKQHGFKYTFSISQALAINKKAINLTIILPKKQYPFLSCIYDPQLLYIPQSEWFDTKYKFDLSKHKLIRNDGPAHIWYSLLAISTI